MADWYEINNIPRPGTASTPTPAPTVGIGDFMSGNSDVDRARAELLNNIMTDTASRENINNSVYTGDGYTVTGFDYAETPKPKPPPVIPPPVIPPPVIPPRVVPPAVVPPTLPTFTYNDPYASQIASLLGQIQTRLNTPIDYENDPYTKALRTAAKGNADIASRQALEMLNARGILNSTIAGDRVAQVTAEELAKIQPEIMRYGQQQWQQGIDNMFSQLEVYNGLNQTGYNRATDAYDREYQAVQDQYNQELNKREAIIAEEKRQIEEALDRVNLSGRVEDPRDAAILGVPVGTLSQKAREIADEYAHELEMEKLSLARSRASSGTSAATAESRRRDTALKEALNEVEMINRTRYQKGDDPLTPEEEQQLINRRLTAYGYDPIGEMVANLESAGVPPEEISGVIVEAGGNPQDYGYPWPDSALVNIH